MPTTEQVSAQLDRLASLDAGPFPVISLYLNLQPNEHGRDQFDTFLRKEFAERVDTYPAKGPERDSLDQDAAKIRDYVASVDAAVNGLVLFASGGADLFEAIPLAAPIDAHRIYISNQAHLYPLARILDEYPRYLAVLTDTHSAQIFVFATNAMVKSEHIENPKTKHHKKGGWSQARYQRHTENFHVKHAKEVVDAVDRIMREEAIDTILVSADDVILPVLREQLPKPVAERIVEILKMDVRAPEHEVLAATMAALRERDAESDRERVEELIGAYRANGLATAGAANVSRAFELGQVDELVITASPEPTGEANELILQARNTSAKMRFIEDASLLEPVGGVGAFLRFKL
jgi:peptide subunit release factor 1 (eRF1)